MPLYIYDCNNCHTRAEYLERRGEKTACYSCRSTDLTRVLQGQTFFAKTLGKSKTPNVPNMPELAEKLGMPVSEFLQAQNSYVAASGFDDIGSWSLHVERPSPDMN